MTGHHLVLCDDSTGGAGAFRALYARHLATCVRQFLGIGPELPAGVRDAHARLAALVAGTVETDEARLLDCFASPGIGTPLGCLRVRDDMPEFRARIDAAAIAMMPRLLFEMGLRGLIGDEETFLWEHGAPALASPALGGEVVPPADATALGFSASGVTALAGGAEVARLGFDCDDVRAACERSGGFRFERRYHRLDDVADFATVDHNPIAAFETHPHKSGNPVDLGGRSEAEWTGILEQAFALVGSFLPQTFGEMRLMLRAVIPVGYDPTRHLSASYREAIGTIYLTLHPNLMTMTEAVVHEFQHNKLNVASGSLDFLSNAFHPLYPSPVRPDPRPLWGILLAVHAFLPVAELHRRLRNAGHPVGALPGFEQRLSELDLKNHEGMEMLRAHAQFTPAGVALFADLEALERRHLAERTAHGLSNVPTGVHVG